MPEETPTEYAEPVLDGEAGEHPPTGADAPVDAREETESTTDAADGTEASTGEPQPLLDESHASDSYAEVKGGAPSPEDASTHSPEAPIPDERIEELLKGLTAVDMRVEELGRLGQRSADLVDRLHAENQRLRQGELAEATMPLLRDLMKLLDDLDHMLQGQGESQRDLGLVRAALVDLLARNGITPFEPRPGERFDSGRHSADGMRRTDDPGADRTVALTRRAGFARDDGSILRVAAVEVFRHTAGEAESNKRQSGDASPPVEQQEADVTASNEQPTNAEEKTASHG